MQLVSNLLCLSLMIVPGLAWTSSPRILTTARSCQGQRRVPSVPQLSTFHRRSFTSDIHTPSTSLHVSIPPVVAHVGKSIFAYQGSVPLMESFGINAGLFAFFSRKLLKMLTLEGYLHAMALGIGLWHTLGWRGWTVCVLYLILGNLVTKIKFAEKLERGLAEGRGGRRGPENVWGSAATGLACALAAGQTLAGIPSSVWVLGYVASLATKLADTFASEIGKAYGKTTFLITTMQRVEPGTEGAVSAEGTAAAVLGGLLLSVYAAAIGLISPPMIVISTLSAFVATNAESLIGATLQGKKGLDWMTNEVVNFFNTLIGAGLAMVALKLLPL